MAGLAATPLAVLQYDKYQKSKVANSRTRKNINYEKKMGTY